MAFERGMTVGARSHGVRVSETAAYVNFSRATVFKVIEDWSVSRNAWSEHSSCGHQRRVNARIE